MNWLNPSAPTGDLAFGFQPDSASICAAITAGLMTSHMAPALSTQGTYSAGTWPDLRPPPTPCSSASASLPPLTATIITTGIITAATQPPTTQVVTDPPPLDICSPQRRSGEVQSCSCHLSPVRRVSPLTPVPCVTSTSQARRRNSRPDSQAARTP